MRGGGTTNGDRRAIDAECGEAVFREVCQIGPEPAAQVEHTAGQAEPPGVQRPTEFRRRPRVMPPPIDIARVLVRVEAFGHVQHLLHRSDLVATSV
jgi:hypothetical protein